MNLRCRLPVCVLLAVTAASSARGETPAARYAREIKLPPTTQEELIAVTLDAEIYADTRDDFPNMRVQEADGRPVAHVIRRVRSTKERTERKTWSRSPASAKPLENGGLEIVVKLNDDDGRPAGLRLVTPLRDFEQRARVFTSTDGQQWEPAGAETVIFDHSRYVDVRNVDVTFPETERRHFKIVIDDVTVEQESELLLLTRKLQGGDEQGRTEKTVVDRRPFRIERIDFYQDVRQARIAGDAKQNYPTAKPEVVDDAERKQTVVTFAARREPLTSLRLTTPDRNFSRRAFVETRRPDGSTWQPLGEATLARVDFKTLQREESAIAIPESRHTQYRLVIENRDSPPLTVAGVQAEGNVYELVCLAAPGKTYRLLYGNVEPATYDTAAVQELLRSGFEPRRGELGTATSEVAAVPIRTFGWADLLNNRPLLIAVVALLVAALGAGLFRAMKRVGSLPSE